MLVAFHPRRRGLQIRLRRAHVQGAPAPYPVPAVVARAAAPAARAPARFGSLRAYRQHQHLAGLRLPLRARSRPRPIRPRSPCSGPRDPQRIPWQRATPSLLLCLEPRTVQNVSRTRRCAPNPQLSEPTATSQEMALARVRRVTKASSAFVVQRQLSALPNSPELRRQSVRVTVETARD